jgi:hypothetical protein
LPSFCVEFDGDFEFGQHIALDLEREFGGFRGRLGIAHQRAQMIRAEVDFVGQGELGGGDAELVGLGFVAEDFVAARVFHFKGELAGGCCVACGRSIAKARMWMVWPG